MQKNEKFQGVTVNLTGNSGGQLQKNHYLQQEGGGLQFFSGKAQPLETQKHIMQLLFLGQTKRFHTAMPNDTTLYVSFIIRLLRIEGEQEGDICQRHKDVNLFVALMV